MALTRRMFGLGDWASDAYLATPTGQAAMRAAQAAAAKLPAGFTMGDPTSDLWGASYYNGHKVIQVGESGPGGHLYYGLDDGTLGPVVSDATNQAIENAADAAYAVYNYIEGLRTSTNPAMVAVLSDPEWIALAGQPVNWNSLSTELQDKIKQVPNLYNALTAGLSMTPETPPPPPPPPAASSGPAVYLVAGYLFDSTGVIYKQGTNPLQPTGATFTPDEVHSLLTTGQLPAGSTPPGPTAPPPPATSTPVSLAPAPSPSSPTVPSAPPPVPGPPAPQSPNAPSAPIDVTPGPGPMVLNPSGPDAPMPPGGGAAPATTGGDSSWMLYAALGVLAVVAIRSSKR